MFSAREVWDTIRLRSEEVNWVDSVWFPQCIPRHAFHMWLLLRKKLKTHENMRCWDVGGAATNHNLLVCSLCKAGPDSHEHMFFGCAYSSQVWHLVRDLPGMANISSNWSDIMNWLESNSKSKSASAIIGKICVAATAYYIWQERNQRTFANKVRTAAQLQDIIVQTIRYRMVSLRF
uniref:uncharacterized protein LOC122601291 n=1 Tax=Erigeron canadensis TaxID=72917 RepID=UPI001CB9D211|nr:uncharacterized protein LOC122601291 [Erigeron canadensis]